MGEQLSGGKKKYGGREDDAQAPRVQMMHQLQGYTHKNSQSAHLIDASNGVLDLGIYISWQHSDEWREYRRHTIPFSFPPSGGHTGVSSATPWEEIANKVTPQTIDDKTIACSHYFVITLT